MMTEKDARDKFCPYTAHLYPQEMCRATRCMMWRWAGDEREVRKVYLNEPEAAAYKRVDGPTASLDGELWIYGFTDVDLRGRFDEIHRAKTDARIVGYCGLAGKPE